MVIKHVSVHPGMILQVAAAAKRKGAGATCSLVRMLNSPTGNYPQVSSISSFQWLFGSYFGLYYTLHACNMDIHTCHVFVEYFFRSPFFFAGTADGERQ